jgi:hypothetical protein
MDNAAGAWLHTQFSSSAAAIQIIYAKYAVFIILFIGFCLEFSTGMKIKRYEWFGIYYLVATVLMAIAILAAHPGEKALARVYIYVFPVIIYFSGLYVGNKSDFGIRYLISSFAISYILISIIFAALNVLLGSVELWGHYLNYASFILDVKGFSDDVVDGLHGNFYYTYQGISFVRFVGSFGDPLALAYAGMTAVVPAYYLLPKYRALIVILFACFIGASFTRAVFLILPIAVAIYYRMKKTGFGVALIISVLGLSFTLIFGDFISDVSENSSTAAHVLSVSKIFEFLDPATIISGALVSGKIPEFEPAMLNVLFLFGLGPTILFIMFMRGIYIDNSRENSPTVSIAILMIAAIISLSIISGVFFATTSSWFAWFLAGFASKRSISYISNTPPYPEGKPVVNLQ